MRWRSRVKPARPYICLLIILVLVLTPSVRPLWCGRVSAAVAAWMSRSRPRVKECRWCRSAACAPVVHCWSLASLPGSGSGRAAKDVMRLARGGHLGAGCGEFGERLVLAGGEAVRPGEQDPGGLPE